MYRLICVDTTVKPLKRIDPTAGQWMCLCFKLFYQSNFLITFVPNWGEIKPGKIMRRKNRRQNQEWVVK